MAVKKGWIVFFVVLGVLVVFGLIFIIVWSPLSAINLS